MHDHLAFPREHAARGIGLGIKFVHCPLRFGEMSDNKGSQRRFTDELDTAHVDNHNTIISGVKFILFVRCLKILFVDHSQF